MRRFVTSAGLAALVLGVAACTGYGSPSPSNPSPSIPPGPSAPPAGTITINIVGNNGAQSFSPNPSTVPAGQNVVWHNLDTTTHRVVFDDGEFDTGNIAPGAFSPTMVLGAPGPYHCSIHPPMVGKVVSGQ